MVLLQFNGSTGCGVFKKSFWLKINCSQMKLLNFENWSRGGCQKLDIILENKIKNVNNKKCAPKFVIFNEKNQKDSDNF